MPTYEDCVAALEWFKVWTKMVEESVTRKWRWGPAV
jgi:hypothetical protein